MAKRKKAERTPEEAMDHLLWAAASAEYQGLWENSVYAQRILRDVAVVFRSQGIEIPTREAYEARCEESRIAWEAQRVRQAAADEERRKVKMARNARRRERKEARS